VPFSSDIGLNFFDSNVSWPLTLFLGKDFPVTFSNSVLPSSLATLSSALIISSLAEEVPRGEISYSSADVVRSGI